MATKTKEDITGDDTLNVEETKVDLDKILIEEIGQFGKYQLRVMFMVWLLAFIGGYSGNEHVFTAARINTRCLIPECEGDTPTEFSPSWLSNAVPSSGGSFDSCQRFANLTSWNMTGSCPAGMFDQAKKVPCEEYVYENRDTIVYEFGLACEEWKRSLIGSVNTFGMMFALAITGIIADRFGRRTALVFNAFNRTWLGLCRYWANNYTTFIVLEYLEAAFGAAGFACIYIIVMELMGPKYRVAAGATLSTCFSLGLCLQAVVAWAVPYWRTLTLVLYIPQFIVIVYIWIFPESIRWYMSKGRYEESEAILKKAARMNGKILSEKSLESLRLSSEEEKKRAHLDKVVEPWLVTLVFQNKPILKRCIVTPVWWLTTLLVYYGLSMNAVNMSGNKYLNYAIVALVEIPGFWTAVLLMDRIGRRALLCGAFMVCAACQIGFIFLPDDMFLLSLGVYMFGKYAISSVVTCIYTYTNELYPTEYRSRLMNFSSLIGRIGSITAPLTPALAATVWDQLPFALFGSMAFIAGCLAFLMPETRGIPLPDTMQQAAEMGKKKNNA